MSERITPAMLTASTLADVNSALSSLQRTSSELSSGRSILKPSDDPYGSARAIELQSELDGLGSYASSAQDGIAWQGAATGAMSSMNSALQRIRELLVQASNGTYDQTDRASIASEVEQLAQTVKQEANTQYAGQYVFAGSATETPPYSSEGDEYRGNHEAIARAIGPGSSVSVSTDISTLLGNGSAAKDGKLLDTLSTIAAHLRGSSPEQVSALGSSDLTRLDENMETLTQLQATAGTVSEQLQTAVGRVESLRESVAQALSGVQDVDFAKASMDYSNEQAAYDAALRAGANIVQESLLNFLH